MDRDQNSLEDVFRSPAKGRGRAKLLPKLAPAQSDGSETAAPEIAATAARLARPESDDVCAFLTVYALNACVMLFAFPVGMVLLVYNILAGENLRTSAHVMGLTGLMTALPLIGTPVPFIA